MAAEPQVIPCNYTFKAIDSDFMMLGTCYVYFDPVTKRVLKVKMPHAVELREEDSHG